MEKLDKKVNLYVFVVRTIVSLFFYIAYVAIILYPKEKYDAPFIKDLLIILGGFIIFLIIIYHLIIPFFTYRYYSYEIKEDEVLIKKGVIFKKTTYLPIKRIQHVEKLEGPIQILFKQATVRIFTAGSVDVIFGLSINKADELVFNLNAELNILLKDEDNLNE